MSVLSARRHYYYLFQGLDFVYVITEVVCFEGSIEEYTIDGLVIS